MASSLLYETLIHESYALGRQVPEIVLISFPFTRGLSLDEGQANEKILEDELSHCINILVKSGVGTGVLACNTLHLILKKLPLMPILFHHLPDLVVKAAQERKHHRFPIKASKPIYDSIKISAKTLAGLL